MRAWIITLINVAVAALAIGVFVAGAGAGKEHETTTPSSLPTTTTTVDREAEADHAAHVACTTWQGGDQDQAVAYAADAARGSFRWQALYKAMVEGARQSRILSGRDPIADAKKGELSDYGPLGHQVEIIMTECAKVAVSP